MIDKPTQHGFQKKHFAIESYEFDSPYRKCIRPVIRRKKHSKLQRHTIAKT